MQFKILAHTMEVGCSWLAPNVFAPEATFPKATSTPYKSIGSRTLKKNHTLLLVIVTIIFVIY